MRYLVLLYGDEKTDNNPGGDGWAEIVEGHNAFQGAAGQRGALRYGEALLPTTMATTVRVRDGKRLVTDGPFAETREQLGGFYVLDCKDLDEAVELVSMIPSARTGSVEVRPIMELGAENTASDTTSAGAGAAT